MITRRDFLKTAALISAGLTRTADPRILGQGDVFNRYPYYAGYSTKRISNSSTP